LAERIFSIDVSFASIKDGMRNAASNGVANITYLCSKTEKFLEGCKIGNADVVVDPPRCGLHPKTLETLLELTAKNIIYVSCNPKTMVRDLQCLRRNYKINSIEAFDFFPHTRHIEVLSHLSLNIGRDIL
jgi:23S rRNA (uracil1939-C5)-methyltransferase